MTVYPATETTAKCPEHGYVPFGSEKRPFCPECGQKLTITPPGGISP